jgi:hypothetical protein
MPRLAQDDGTAAFGVRCPGTAFGPKGGGKPPHSEGYGEASISVGCYNPRAEFCSAAGVSARAFRKRGAVAQLGERLNGIQEVDGSIPFGSTKQIKN